MSWASSPCPPPERNCSLRSSASATSGAPPGHHQPPLRRMDRGVWFGAPHRRAAGSAHPPRPHPGDERRQQALGRDPHTLGRWAAAFGAGGTKALIFEQSGGSPRPRSGVVEGSGPRSACGSGHRSGQLEMEGGPPVRLGAVRHLPEPRQLSELPPSTRGQALHQPGFVLKRPRKRLVKADERKREAFVADYARLWDEARRCGSKFFFAGEAVSGGVKVDRAGVRLLTFGD